MATQLEKEYVLNVYNSIGDHFSATRGYKWQCVKDFLENKDGLHILDAGCGNGKNMLNKNIKFTGCDASKKMVEICLNRGLDTTECDITNLNYDDNKFDHTMCVAVIHHLSNIKRRENAISELIRVTKQNGTIMITAWCSDLEISKPVFKNWELQKRYSNDNTVKEFKRFYYLFSKTEFINLFDKFNIEILNFYEEKNNWIIIIKKLM